jgi:hypothetical protein
VESGQSFTTKTTMAVLWSKVKGKMLSPSSGKPRCFGHARYGDGTRASLLNDASKGNAFVWVHGLVLSLTRYWICVRVQQVTRIVTPARAEVQQDLELPGFRLTPE